MTEIQQRLEKLDALAKYRCAFRDILADGKRRYIAPGLSMQVNYPTIASIHVLLHRKRQRITPSDVTLVQKRIEARGWTLSVQYEGKGFWEGTFV